MKKGYLAILLFGFILAVFALMLQFFEYKYFIGSLTTEIYTAIVATIFTMVGVWIGINLFKKKNTVAKNSAEINLSKVKAFKLNEREYEILQLIAKGLSNQEIAGQLFLAIPTVKTHISNLYSKLDVKSRTQAVHKGQSMNLI